MHMHKKLLGASFEQSQRIVPNLFKKKPFSYDLGLSDSPKISSRVILMIPFGMLVGVMYALGVGLPQFSNIANNSELHFITRDIWTGISYFTFLKPTILFLIISWGVLVFLNIFPKPNYSIQRAFAVISLLLMILLMCVSIAPLMLGGLSGQ